MVKRLNRQTCIMNELAQRVIVDPAPLPAASPKKKGRGKKQAPFVAPPELVELCDQLGRDAVECTLAYTTESRDGVIRASAVFLDVLTQIWGKRALDPLNVWLEIDHRIQLGELLMRFNRDTPRPMDSPRKVWRPSSTKLP